LATKKNNIRIVVVFLLFIAYFLIAARPVPRETILAPGWISSLQTETPVPASGYASQQYVPFILGNRFGYVDSSGQFAINRIKSGEIYLGENVWAEYTAEPSSIEIKNILEETIINIENAGGYPVLLDNRFFIFGSEQNELSEIGADGSIMWTYQFGAPLTCIDAADGLVVTGSLDGMVEVLDSGGNRIYYFEPGGSHYAVILGCAISRNGSMVGIISGIDQQRFLMLERFGNTGGDYRVIYHEFLETGFRRPVHILFIDEDRRLVFEREGGLGCYNIRSRRGIFIPLDGEIAAIDDSGSQGLFFLIISHSMRRNELIGIRIPQDRNFNFFGAGDMRDAIFMKASFKSDDVFMGRTGSMLIAGGGTTLVSFKLEDK
jgi:hypothetical protein